MSRFKVHYDPLASTYDPYDDADIETACCGTLLQKDVLNYTGDKNKMTCKKCIKRFDLADKEMEFHSQNFANDCEDFVNHVNQTN